MALFILQDKSPSHLTDLPIHFRGSTEPETDLPSPTPLSPVFNDPFSGVDLKERINTSPNFAFVDDLQPSAQSIILTMVPFPSDFDDSFLRIDIEEEINIPSNTASAGDPQSLVPLTVMPSSGAEGVLLGNPLADNSSGSDPLEFESQTAVDAKSDAAATTAIVLWECRKSPGEGVSSGEGSSGKISGVADDMYFEENLSDPLYVVPPVAAHIPESSSFADSPGHFGSVPLFSTSPNDVVCHVVTAMIDAFLERILGDHRFPSLQDFRESSQKISPALLSLGVSEGVWRDFCMGMENDIVIVEEHQRFLSGGSFLKDHEKKLSFFSNVLADIEAHVSAGDIAVKGNEAIVQEFQSQRLEAVTSHYQLRGDLKRVDDEISSLGARRRDIVRQLEEVAERTSSISEKQRGADQVLQQGRVELETWKMAREDTFVAQSIARSVLTDFKDKQTTLQRVIADRQKNVSARAACFRSSSKTFMA